MYAVMNVTKLNELEVIILKEFVSVIKILWKVSAFTGNVDRGIFIFFSLKAPWFFKYKTKFFEIKKKPFFNQKRKIYIMNCHCFQINLLSASTVWSGDEYIMHCDSKQEQ